MTSDGQGIWKLLNDNCNLLRSPWRSTQYGKVRLDEVC